ncbi:hypothetical protein GCM10017322_39270 [Paracoccus aerius]|nr:hypothetical protein GCM10017322_39270 [Paracoccus aerius]
MEEERTKLSLVILDPNGFTHYTLFSADIATRACILSFTDPEAAFLTLAPSSKEDQLCVFY